MDREGKGWMGTEEGERGRIGAVWMERKEREDSSVDSDDLLHFYLSVSVKTVCNQAGSWVCVSCLEHVNRIERIQKRAMLIIYGIDYKHLCKTNVLPLYERRESLCKRFFKTVFDESSCLHYLLPEPRNSDVIDRLRNPIRYTAATPRTSRFEKSFLMHGLNNYQPTA